MILGSDRSWSWNRPAPPSKRLALNRARYVRYVAQDRTPSNRWWEQHRIRLSTPDALTLDTVELADNLPCRSSFVVLWSVRSSGRPSIPWKRQTAIIDNKVHVFSPHRGSAHRDRGSHEGLVRPVQVRTLLWHGRSFRKLPCRYSAGRTRRQSRQCDHRPENSGGAVHENLSGTAFREVADELAARGTYTEQLAAQISLVGATGNAYIISRARYKILLSYSKNLP